MSLIHRLLVAGPAYSTHGRIALDALAILRCDAGWRRMFLRHSARLLAGIAAPEEDFADFKNHVFFVRDGQWGGAPAAARAWYLRTVYALRDRLWPEAAYAAGVLCHYVVDPFMPLHTAQTDAAGAVHYGIDLAIERSYGRLRRQLLYHLGGYPNVETPNGKDWLERMLRLGAEQAHANYDLLIDHCEPNLLLHRPGEGMDEEAHTAVAKLLGLATATFARIVERALEESGAAVPKSNLFGVGLSLAVRAPIAWLAGPLARMSKRAALHRMVREYQKTGKVIAQLSPAEREVRQLHAVEVRRITLEQLDAEPVRRPGSKHPRSLAAVAAAEAKPATAAVKSAPSAPKPVEKPAPKLELEAPRPAPKVSVPLPPSPPPAPKPAATIAPAAAAKPPESEPAILKLRFPVSMSSPVTEAPGISPQVADQLVELGVENVGDLLTVDPKVVVEELKSANLTTEKVLDWQSAAALACQLPEIRANDVLLLIAAGVHEPRQLSRFAPKELLDRLQPFLRAADSPDMIRLDPPPTLRDVSQWVELAKKARPLADAA